MPVLDTLIELVTRGRSIPVHLNSLARLESLVAEVQAWKECADNTFLMKNSPYSLLEVSSQLVCVQDLRSPRLVKTCHPSHRKVASPVDPCSRC